MGWNEIARAEKLAWFFSAREDDYLSHFRLVSLTVDI